MPWDHFLRVCAKGTSLKFIFLDASHTEAVGRKLADICDASVICHRGHRNLEACMDFSMCFYSALLEGSNVKRAFEKATSSLEGQGPVDASVSKSILLLPRSMPHAIKLAQNGHADVCHKER